MIYFALVTLGQLDTMQVCMRYTISLCGRCKWYYTIKIMLCVFSMNAKRFPIVCGGEKVELGKILPREVEGPL